MTQPTILVTGATDGIGKQTALELAKAGATVIVHGRNAAKCEAVARDIRAATRNSRIETAVFDLASLAAIRTGAAELADRHPKLDVLLHNAGVYLRARETTVDGYETTFAVNHLAPFLLTQLLLPQVEASGVGRIITVSSTLHMRARMAWDDLQLEQSYSGFAAYAQSKLANVLFANELAERVRNKRITSNSLHPGVIATKLLHEGFGAGGGASLAQGAVTSVYLALSPEVAQVTGRYFSNAHLAESSPLADDPAARTRLWEMSEKLCGLAGAQPAQPKHPVRA